MALLTGSRMALFFFNPGLFGETSTTQLSQALFFGLRFDLSTLCMLFSPFILLNTIPLNVRYNKGYQKVGNLLFLIATGLSLMANLGDAIYYRFTLRRTTGEIFTYLINDVGNDIGGLLSSFLFDFWYLFIIWAIVMWASNRLLRLWNPKTPRFKGLTPKQFLGRITTFLLFIAMLIIGIRGGIQLKPINIIQAGKHSNAQQLPLVINTPFSIIKTIGKNPLVIKHDYPDPHILNHIYQPYHSATTDTSQVFSSQNVVVIILESFSAEHTGYFNTGKTGGFTPFLDSLMHQGTAHLAIANSKRSHEGIPAILASIPTLSSQAYISGPYAGNKIQSIASLLKPFGYSSAFFHGGKNGTMGFESFTNIAGFDRYFGKDQYPRQEDFDGKWGIFDEPYLQYVVDEFNQMEPPFVGSFFTLSSHHPYTIPPQHKGKFRQGPLKIQQTIGYADYALKRFFEKAKKQDWFANTLFVITADHTSEGGLPYYKTSYGQHLIPLIFYSPSTHLPQSQTPVVQQIDIMPSVLDYLNFPESYFSFGSSVFDTTANHFGIYYSGNSYELIHNNFLLRSDTDKSQGLYDLKTDSLLQNNLLGKGYRQEQQLDSLFKAVVQQYNNRMIENRLTRP